MSSAAPRAFAPLDFLQLLAIAVIWGVNNVAAKVAVDAFPPMMTVALRFGIVLVVLIPWLRPPPRAILKPLIIIALLVGPLHFGVQYVGLALADDLAPMIVVMQLWVPFSVVFAALMLKEPISWLRMIGVGAAFAGAAGMTFDPLVFAQGFALLLVTISVAIYGLGTVLVRRLGGADAWAMQAWIALATAPAMIAGSLIFERGQADAALNAGWLPWACVAFGALASSVIANFFMFRLVQRYEVSRTTPYLLLSPLIAFLLSAVLLRDPITPQIAAGGAATIVGVALVAIAERRWR